MGLLTRTLLQSSVADAVCGSRQHLSSVLSRAQGLSQPSCHTGRLSPLGGYVVGLAKSVAVNSRIASPTLNRDCGTCPSPRNREPEAGMPGLFALAVSQVWPHEPELMIATTAQICREVHKYPGAHHPQFGRRGRPGPLICSVSSADQPVLCS